ncbi:MAG TPA: trypsin-like peptidase domain-containing protein, partial [Pirellulaceae bacterium]
MIPARRAQCALVRFVLAALVVALDTPPHQAQEPNIRSGSLPQSTPSGSLLEFSAAPSPLTPRGEVPAGIGIAAAVPYPGIDESDLKTLDRMSSALRSVVARIQPSIVHIEAVKKNPDADAQGNSLREAGSGVIVPILNQPHILTNYHVIRGTPRESVDVQLADGRVFHPQQIWFDESTDVAVLRIEDPDLLAARVGNSDQIELGDFVLAYGSPFGLSYSVSHGIVSAKGRRNLDLGIGSVRIQDFIQTDAAINPGNSGGPLLNLRGEVVGLNTAIASNSGGNEGIGFSIPVNLAVRVAEQLIREGAVSRPRLGVKLDREYMGTDSRRRGNHVAAGARVADVYGGSAAAAAGVRTGDIIAQLNQVAVEDDGHLMFLVGTLPSDQPCSLVVER